MITLKAHGKINLSLDITGRRKDGYHDISSVMQSVELCDIVTLDKNTTGEIRISVEPPLVPCNEENIAYKACRFMKELYDIPDGFDITIQKNIPVAGGMAGGSTDAAAVIRGVNTLCDLKLDTKELMAIGLNIGADVPFCIGETAALATGVGEVLTPISGLQNTYWIVLVNPGTHVSTKTIYEAIDKTSVYGTVDNERLVTYLANDKINEASAYMKNIMEPVTAKYCPEITDAIKTLKSAGAMHAMMSGSGATCFGIFKDEPDIREINQLFPEYFVCLTKPLKKEENEK